MNESKPNSIVDAVNPVFCSVLFRSVSTYFQDEKHEAEFEKWYFKKYGVPYKRKTLK